MGDLGGALCLGALGLGCALVLLMMAGCLDITAKLDDDEERRDGTRRS
jgi:hypothetical protein